MSSIRFIPWRGDQYDASPLFGKRVLVLGESHYQWDQKKPIESMSTLTRDCILEQISGNDSKAFWTKIAVAFLNRRPSLAEKASFWHSIAFYNYVQFNVGNGPRIAPRKQMWTESEPAFFEVLKDLRPHVVIALGYRLWPHLPEAGRESGPSIEGAEQSKTWRYTFEEGTSLTYGISHPSSGFSGQYWHPYVMRAIQLA